MSNGELIVLYKSMAELDRDRSQLLAECAAEHAKICREDDVLKALIEGDAEVLDRAAASEIELAKSQEAGFERARCEKASSLLQSLGRLKFTNSRLDDWGRSTAKKFDEHKRLRARSERFLRRLGAN